MLKSLFLSDYSLQKMIEAIFTYVEHMSTTIVILFKTWINLNNYI